MRDTRNNNINELTAAIKAAYVSSTPQQKPQAELLPHCSFFIQKFLQKEPQMSVYHMSSNLQTFLLLLHIFLYKAFLLPPNFLGNMLGRSSLWTASFFCKDFLLPRLHVKVSIAVRNCKISNCIHDFCVRTFQYY